MKISLDGNWKLYYYEADSKDVASPADLEGIEAIPCTVPGNVELDLQAQGLLPDDLYMGENILQAEKYETYEWWYETEFDGVKLEAGQTALLHFEGVDCFADYFVNGELIGSSNNMYIPHDFDVTKVMKQGKNTLHVHIASALITETDMPNDFYSAGCSWHIYAHSTKVRKAPHSYGWDIMPRALSAGIWRSVSLDVHEEVEFKQFFINVDRFFGNTTSIKFIYEIKLPHRLVKAPLKLRIHGECKDSVIDEERAIIFNSGVIELWLDNLIKWWPYGYGEPNLYDFTIDLLCNGEVLITHRTKVGVRTVEFIHKDILDEKNLDESGFTFKINGVPVVCKGMNWVPMDVYHSRDAERYQKALELASDVGCNILRCWGGNVYEDEYFFNYCDEHGIMVWQDFAMACNLYPQNEAFAELIKTEAEAIIKRLRQHPSLVIWVGDNECDAIHINSGWNADPNVANKVTRQLLPDAVMMHDRCRPYLASSPMVSSKVYEAQRYDLMPEEHLWGPRDFYKSDYYRLSKANFVSETGYHGCPSPEFIKKFIEPDHIWPNKDDPQWILHSTDQTGNPGRVNLMANQIKQLFGIEADNIDDFAFASQVSQAEADKYFVERVRLQRAYGGGILVWNLIDGWPQFSDAVVGYYYDKKIAYYYLKRCMAPFAMMFGEINNLHHSVWAVNDTQEVKSGHCKVYDGETGEIFFECDYSIPPLSRVGLGSVKCDYSDKKLLIVRWDNGFNHYVTGSIPFDLDTYKRWYEILKSEESK